MLINFFEILDSDALKIALVSRMTFSRYVRNYMHYAVFMIFDSAVFKNKATNANVYQQNRQNLFLNRM